MNLLELFDKEIRVKNAVALLVGLLLAGVVFFFGRQQAWYQELFASGGVAAIGVALSGVVIAAFLIVILVWTAISSHFKRLVRKREQAQHKKQKTKDEQARQMELINQEERRQQEIVDTLNSLRPSQIHIVLRFLHRGVQQLEAFEIGDYEAAWGPDMQLLIEKGVARQYARSRMFEIEPRYWEFLRNHWNPESGLLI